MERRLSGFDLFVLWGDLSIGLLVALTGTLLVPALGLPAALAAIVIGSILGSIPLALVGVVGARERQPSMFLFRPVLGVRGSYVPTVLNILQLVGWTGFELWVMSLVADRISRSVLGFSSYWLWLPVVTALCVALAAAGPVQVVRRWLERFGAWVLLGVAAWITFRLLRSPLLGTAWRRAGEGGLPFWVAVDLAAALPVSWLPLVADYNRFGERPRAAGFGTFAGYAVGNAWFYALGAILAATAALPATTPAALGDALAALAGGAIVLLALLVGETDEAFADIYSAAVSSQNLRPNVPLLRPIVVVGLAGAGLAAVLGLRPAIAFDTYEAFLFLLGSVFVPLFGVFVAHHFVGRRPAPVGDAREGFDVRAFAPWLVGFLVYQLSVPTGPEPWRRRVEALRDALHLPLGDAGSVIGASVPSFLVAMLAAVALRAVRSPSGDRAGVSR